MFPDGKTVKRGTFLYSGETVCDVCIQKTDRRYGTGDEEDEPEWRDDLEGEFYYVWYSPAGSRGEFRSGGGVFSTLTDAIRHVEESRDGVHWLS